MAISPETSFPSTKSPRCRRGFLFCCCWQLPWMIYKTSMEKYQSCLTVCWQVSYPTLASSVAPLDRQPNGLETLGTCSPTGTDKLLPSAALSTNEVRVSNRMLSVTGFEDYILFAWTMPPLLMMLNRCSCCLIRCCPSIAAQKYCPLALVP